MNKKILFMIICFTMVYSFVFAQNWRIGGNGNASVPAAGGEFGTIGNRPVIFETNNTERARLLNGTGFWGFGTISPNARVHINGTAGETPFRVQVSGQTRLYVDVNGGVAVGLNSVPPSQGLFVSGNAGIGTTTPVTKLQVTGGSDVSPTGGGFIVSGSTTSANIGMDDNEIMARNNGVVSDLFFNNNGGDVIVNGAGSGGFVVGTSAPATNFRATINETTNAALILGTLNGVGSYLTVNKPSTSSSADVVRIRDDGSSFAVFSNTTALFQLTLTGDALASGGVWQNSDKRIKRDIKPVTSAMDNLMKLKPSVYYFDRDQAKYKYLNLPKELQFGLIAQEVKGDFPNIVREYNTYDEDGKARTETMHSINYTALIPVLIQGMQEQQKMITALQQKIEQLEAVSSVTSASNDDLKAGSNSVSGAVLEQNQPNPFNQTTVIRYRLPQNASGQINIYDNSGKMLKSIKANESGQATINAGDLKSGTYTYALSVNGRLAATKKLVIAK